jgi:hypothetical protein
MTAFACSREQELLFMNEKCLYCGQAVYLVLDGPRTHYVATRSATSSVEFPAV